MLGDNSPLFYWVKMISKKNIEVFLSEELEDSDIFLVDVLVKSGNGIRVFVDKPEGITIQECYNVSRMITGEFDREVEDYSLDVSSPGLDIPLMKPAQYEKNLEKEVKVVLNDGGEHKGILKSHNELGIELFKKNKVRIEGKKNKQWEEELLTLKFDDIKTVKVVISFK